MPFQLDLRPEALLRKFVLAFTQRESETSDNPEFLELKTRRYRAPVGETYDAAVTVLSRWLGWQIKTRQKNLGGMALLKCEVTSLALGGNTLELSIWFTEETLPDGTKQTSVNCKCISNAPTKGDLGETQRAIAFFLSALDDEVIETPITQTVSSAPSQAPNSEPSLKPESPATPTPERKPIVVQGTKGGKIQIKQIPKSDKTNVAEQ
ncbi:MAG: hypothetical protein RML35_06145 [Chloroherpetonaceae bacterium]|nr:hypothetical protein [Chloroherpetonaceae bacterium]